TRTNNAWPGHRQRHRRPRSKRAARATTLTSAYKNSSFLQPLFPPELHTIFLFEPFHPAASFHYPHLLPCVEGMAGGADFHPDILLGGEGFNHITASASNGGLVNFGVNTFF